MSAKQNQHALVYSEGSAENYRRVEATDAITEGAGSRRIEQIIAFSSKDHGQDAAEDLAPTLRSMSHQNSHVNGGGQAAVAFAQNQRGEVRDLDNRAGALSAEPGMKQQTYVTVPSVRRLTPLECERLQGFPDNWTAVPGNSDTQRYKQLGNAVAVPVAEWIFRRILASESGRIF